MRHVTCQDKSCYLEPPTSQSGSGEGCSNILFGGGFTTSAGLDNSAPAYLIPIKSSEKQKLTRKRRSVSQSGAGVAAAKKRKVSRKSIKKRAKKPFNPLRKVQVGAGRKKTRKVKSKGSKSIAVARRRCVKPRK